MKRFPYLALSLGCAIILVGCNEDAEKEERDILPILIDESLYKYHVKETQDFYEFEDVQIKEDLLNIFVSYIGGCGAHEFSLIASDLWTFSIPPAMSVVLIHRPTTDTCNTRIFNNLLFELEPLRDSRPFYIAIHNGPSVFYDNDTP